MCEIHIAPQLPCPSDNSIQGREQQRRLKCRPATDHRPVSSDVDVLVVFCLPTFKCVQRAMAWTGYFPSNHLSWASVRALPPAVKCIVNFTLFSAQLLLGVGGSVDSVWVPFFIEQRCVCVRQTI